MKRRLSMTDKDYFGKDKAKHFGVCLVAAIIHPFLSIGLAIGKEYGDNTAKGNHWCWIDLLFDFLGCAGGMCIHWWIFKRVNF